MVYLSPWVLLLMSALGDSDSFHKLISSEFKIDDIRIDKVTHLGKLIGEKPRPLSVTLGDSSAQRNILRNVKLCIVVAPTRKFLLIQT